jgi:hypothetical protein
VFHKFNKESAVNQYQLMRGVCQTCKTTIDAERKDTTISKRRDWGETPSVECPKCNAVVYMMTVT